MAKSKEVGTSATLSERQIKAALSAVEAHRRDAGKRLRTKVFQRARIQSQVQKLLIPYLKKTGLDIAAFEKIQQKAKAEMDRLAKKQKADAIKHASSAKAGLRLGVDGWLNTMRDLHLSPTTPDYFLVETPLEISAAGAVELDDSHIEPGNNWAKFKIPWTDTGGGYGGEDLYFSFVWQNPNDGPVVVNVLSVLSLNGICEAAANAGFALWPGGKSQLWMYAVLWVLEARSHPQVIPVGEDIQNQEVLDLEVDLTGLFGPPGDIEIVNVRGNAQVGYNNFSLPPKGLALINVSLEVWYTTDNGSVQLDFSSSGYEVACPAVAVTILP